MDTIIRAENIVKSFGTGGERRAVLNKISIEIKAGEFVSVMGPSGSGKSTLMYVLSGMDGADSGTVEFDGRELSSLKEYELADLRRRSMGFVFQQPSMLKNLNILDNIILPSVRDNRKKALEITEKAKMLMKRTGISELERRGITRVSGGQLQRAGICRALMNSPKVVFGDEPTGALNSKSAREIMDVFAEINSGGTAVMLVTHDAKIAARTERILFMRDGKIVCELKLPKFDGIGLDGRVETINRKMEALEI